MALKELAPCPRTNRSRPWRSRWRFYFEVALWQELLSSLTDHRFDLGEDCRVCISLALTQPIGGAICTDGNGKQ